MTDQRSIGWALSFLLFATALPAAAQPNPEAFPDTTAPPDTTKDYTTSINAYPYLFYTPETELAFGAGGIMTFYTAEERILRPSKIALSGYYSTNAQYYMSVSPELYFSRNEIFTKLDINFGHIVDRFYGVGNDTPDLGNEDYETDRFAVEFGIQVPAILFVSDRSGLFYEYEHSSIIDRLDNPYLEPGVVAGSEGGDVSGLGCVWVWDSRDHTFYPTSGVLHHLRFTAYTSTFGSDFTFSTYEFEGRRYFSLGPGHVLAVNGIIKGATSGAPFHQLPALGGQHLMRGYYEGRYRDHTYAAMQFEYRRRLGGRFGYVVFGSFGDVGREFTNLKLDELKFAAGAGLRFLFNKKENVNLRADFGVGKNSTGVYFGIEEAF